MEYIENNKLIAEFMGGVFDNHNEQPQPYWEFWEEEPPHTYPYIFNRHLNYYSSWDWLMPVAEKIGDENNLSFDIETTYIKVVEFIKWYNKKH